MEKRLDKTLTTPSLYGDNEVMLGKWFKQTGKRNEIFLASKFGISMKSRDVASFVIDSSPENCKKCCNGSLERLGFDCIGLCSSVRNIMIQFGWLTFI